RPPEAPEGGLSDPGGGLRAADVLGVSRDEPQASGDESISPSSTERLINGQRPAAPHTLGVVELLGGQLFGVCRAESPQIRRALDGGASGLGEIGQKAMHVVRAPRVDDPLIGRAFREACAHADGDAAAAALPETLREGAAGAARIREHEPRLLLPAWPRRNGPGLPLFPSDPREVLR